MRFAVCRCLRWLVRSFFQDPIDDSRERTQLWPASAARFGDTLAAPRTTASYDRLAVYTKHPRGLAGAHPLDMTRPPNPCVQLHPIHPPRLPVRATLDRRLYTVPFWSAAAGSTGRFSGGLLLCRSQATQFIESPPQFWWWADANGSIRVHEGEPIKTRGWARLVRPLVGFIATAKTRRA